jgi:hypothetical protein
MCVSMPVGRYRTHTKLGLEPFTPRKTCTFFLFFFLNKSDFNIFRLASRLFLLCFFVGLCTHQGYRCAPGVVEAPLSIFFLVRYERRLTRLI